MKSAKYSSRIAKLLLPPAVLVLGLAGSTGVAHATDILVVDPRGVPYSWATSAQCMKDGPDVRLDDAAADIVYKYWYCQQGAGDLWYLHNTDMP